MKYADLKILLETARKGNIFTPFPYESNTPEPLPTYAKLECIESNSTVKQLRELAALILSEKTHDPDAEIDPILLDQLKRFLANRWERIKDTNNAYPHNTHLPANQFCLLIAEALAKEDPTLNKYQLLMPTLETTEDEMSGIDLDELSLGSFVLSDDNTTFIPVEACLSYVSARGKLKILVNGTPRKLTPSEKRRVINHSQSARDYYYSALQLYKFKNKGASVGSMVQWLADQLELGGRIRRGFESDFDEDGTVIPDGENASVAISAFSQFIDSLDSQKRQQLLQSKYTDSLTGEERTFEYDWARLTPRVVIDPDTKQTKYLIKIGDDEKTVGPDEVGLCVEVRAQNIQLVLDANQWLYDLTTEVTTSNPLTIASLQEETETKKEAVETELKSAPKIRNINYGNGCVCLFNILIQDGQLPNEEFTILLDIFYDLFSNSDPENQKDLCVALRNVVCSDEYGDFCIIRILDQLTGHTSAQQSFIHNFFNSKNIASIVKPWNISEILSRLDTINRFSLLLSLSLKTQLLADPDSDFCTVAIPYICVLSQKEQDLLLHPDSLTIKEKLECIHENGNRDTTIIEIYIDRKKRNLSQRKKYRISLRNLRRLFLILFGFSYLTEKKIEVAEKLKQSLEDPTTTVLTEKEHKVLANTKLSFFAKLHEQKDTGALTTPRLTTVQ